MSKYLIQSKIHNLMLLIKNYDININEFNRYYNAYDDIKINNHGKYIIKYKYFNTFRNIDIHDLNNLRKTYKTIKECKGFYSRYTSTQALDVLRKISILDENAIYNDFYIYMKYLINKHYNSIFFFGSYEQIPIIRYEKDIYNADLNNIFIRIDYNYKYVKQLYNKNMLNDSQI